ncbi:MAG: aminoacyl-tRNA hydrolase [Bacteroidales bacterium]|nr:aminoacyl-tRNA hydrolase [Bacteroidales bacterium]
MKYLIAGLGNFGTEYIDTRHNAGYLVVNELVCGMRSDFESKRYADVAKLGIKGRSLTVIKPTTYMNLSGKAIRYWLEKKKIGIENMLVVVDDINLPIGAIRLRKTGSDGGHNGLQNIIDILGTTNFARLRLGIGGDFMQGSQIDYVLGQWMNEEKEILSPKIKLATEAIKSFVLLGPSKTMTLFNNR